MSDSLSLNIQMIDFSLQLPYFLGVPSTITVRTTTAFQLNPCIKFFYKIIQIITGIELPCEVEVGDGFVIDHFGGIVVSGYAKFGHHCRIRNGVVVGLKNVEDVVAPVFGDYVDIGAGAKVLGRIKIGNHVHIGANAVVLTDVPDNSIAVGVPAVIKMKALPHGR